MAKAVKLTKEQLKKLAVIGITDCKTEEDSREAMVSKLQALEITDEGEPWEDIYDMALALHDDDSDMDDLADEVEEEEEKPAKKSSKKSKKKEEEEDEEEEEDDDEEDDSEDEEEDEYDSDEDEEDSEEDEEEEEDEDEEEEKPAKKTSKKTSKKEEPKKSAPKKEEKKTSTKKEDKKPAAKKIASKRINPKENEEDAKLFDSLKKALKPLGEFEYTFLTNAGVSVKFVGENSSRIFFSFDSPKLVGKELVGRVYSSAVKTDDGLAELFGEDFEIKQDWSGIPIMVNIPLSAIVSALKENKELFAKLLESLEGKDVKLGKNRKKMEEQIKNGKKDKAEEIKEKSKKESAKAKSKKVEKEEEEEEVEEEKPKKKTPTKKSEKVEDKKKTTKKKTSKK